MHACMDGWMDVWMYECMNVWMDGWMYGCMDVWMYGCMDVWMYVHACCRQYYTDTYTYSTYTYLHVPFRGLQPRNNDERLWKYEANRVGHCSTIIASVLGDEDSDGVWHRLDPFGRAVFETKPWSSLDPDPNWKNGPNIAQQHPGTLHDTHHEELDRSNAAITLLCLVRAQCCRVNRL